MPTVVVFTRCWSARLSILRLLPVLQRRLSETPWGPDVAALGLGAGGVLCFAPFGVYGLAPLIWLGYFLLLRQRPDIAQAMRLGFCFGFGFFLCGVSWVYVSLSVFGGMAWWLAGLAAFLFCALLASFCALVAGLFKVGQPGSYLGQALWFAAWMAAVDWFRTWIFSGFPWLALGYSQAAPSPLSGFAPLIGVHGLSFLVALLAALLVRWRVGFVVLLLLASGGYALRQVSWSTPSGEPISVALIQGNVPQEMKFRPEAFVRTLTLYRDLVVTHPAQLTLLPETAIPAFFEQLPASYLAELSTAAQAAGGDLILGTLSGIEDQYWNSAISLGVSPEQRYSKTHLVPFGEIIPPGFSWFLELAHIPMSAFSRGPAGQAPLAVAGQQVAVNICYEDVFGEEIIQSLPAAGILANLSNTAWFGRSLAQPQHLQIAQMRASESARPMLRATNTGMTAIIGPQGDVQAVLPPFTTGVLEGQVQAYAGLTPYARFGNAPVLILISSILLGTMWRRRAA